MDGWIKLHRKTLDNPVVCKDADHLAVWMYLLMNATHKEYPAMFAGQKIMLQPGQLITGRQSIAAKFNISESKVQRIMKSFEIEQQIEQQTSNKNRLISILSWNDYQSVEQQDEQQLNNKRTTTEQQVNTNKNVKNVKNDENVKEDINNSAEPVVQHDGYHQDFESFWTVYPKFRRKDKAKAFGIWKKKVKESEHQLLIQCTERYAADKKTIGPNGQFAKMPSTYLNAGTYKDYLSGGDEHEGIQHSTGSTGKFAEFTIE